MEQLTSYEQFILVSFELCQKAVKDYSNKFSKKTYRQCQLLTLLLLKRYNRWTYRGTEEQVQANPRIQHFLGLKRTPNYSTLQKFYRRLGQEILEKLFGYVLKGLKKALKGKRDALGDSTGYRLTNANPHYVGSRWYLRKTPKQQGKRPLQRFVKHVILVEEKTLLIFSQHASWGPAGDCRELRPVAQKKPPWIRIRALALDKGFDSLANHRYVRCHLKAKDAIRIGNGPPGEIRHPFRRRLMRYFPRVFYRKRSKVEGCISVMKRKFANYLLTRLGELRFHDVLLLGIIYNIHRGIQLGLLILCFIEDFNRTMHCYLVKQGMTAPPCPKQNPTPYDTHFNYSELKDEYLHNPLSD